MIVAHPYQRIEKFGNVQFSSSKHSYHVECSFVTHGVVSLTQGSTNIAADHFSCLNRSSKLLGSIVFVIGGPYQSLGGFPNTYVVTFMMAGFDVYVPRYSGTFDNSVARTKSIMKTDVGGSGEFGKASQEVALLTSWVKRESHRQNIETVLAGESAGGVIVAASCVVACTKRVLLVAPLLQSPEQFWQNYARSAVLSKDPFYEITRGDSGDPVTKERAAKLAAIGFYGERNSNIDFSSRLSKLRGKYSIALFYGDRDPRIGVDLINGIVKRMPGDRIRAFCYEDSQHHVIQSSPRGEETMIAWLRKDGDRVRALSREACSDVPSPS